MSAGIIVAIVAGALALIAILVLASRMARQRRLDQRREHAGGLREDATARAMKADSLRAAADEQAARARREQAEAAELAAHGRREAASSQQRSVEAQRELEAARERRERALEVDPDVDERADQGSAAAGLRDHQDTPRARREAQLGRQGR
jgi:FtsZ-interacting cell division protein ZipA